jgi:hypothetical protein
MLRISIRQSYRRASRSTALSHLERLGHRPIHADRDLDPAAAGQTVNENGRERFNLFNGR